MISVCLATFNGEKYLQRQLDSILPQLNEGDELLISDDGSTDSTLAILENYNRPEITLFRNSFQSPVCNFEFLFTKATGNIIVPCDQDDIWLPGKLETIREHLRSKERFCLLMNAHLIDEADERLDETTFERWRTHTGFWPNLMRNTFMGSSMAFTADLLRTALPIPEKVAMHDWWIGLLAEKTGTVQLLQQAIMLYRIHPNNASLQGSSTLQKVNWRLHILRAVNQRLRKHG